jgi:hypothetical protein
MIFQIISGAGISNLNFSWTGRNFSASASSSFACLRNKASKAMKVMPENCIAVIIGRRIKGGSARSGSRVI